MSGSDETLKFDIDIAEIVAVSSSSSSSSNSHVTTSRVMSRFALGCLNWMSLASLSGPTSSILLRNGGLTAFWEGLWEILGDLWEIFFGVQRICVRAGAVVAGFGGFGRLDVHSKSL